VFVVVVWVFTIVWSVSQALGNVNKLLFVYYLPNLEKQIGDRKGWDYSRDLEKVNFQK
jgi:hypothetical protein